MAKVCTLGLMEDLTKASMMTIKSKDGEFIFGQRQTTNLERSMKDSGIMVSNMVKANSPTQEARAESVYGYMETATHG